MTNFNKSQWQSFYDDKYYELQDKIIVNTRGTKESFIRECAEKYANKKAGELFDVN